MWPGACRFCYLSITLRHAGVAFRAWKGTLKGAVMTRGVSDAPAFHDTKVVELMSSWHFEVMSRLLTSAARVQGDGGGSA